MKKSILILSIIFLFLVFNNEQQNNKIQTNQHINVQNQEKSEELDSPPNLNVELNGEKICVALGSYTWRQKIGENKYQCIAVSGAEFGLKGAPTFKAPGKSILVVNTKTNPDKLEIISNNNDNLSQDTDSNTLLLPEKKGIYSYRIYCIWNGKGSASYEFNIEIM